MKYDWIRTFFSLLVGSFLIWTCTRDAPRDNIFDPDSELWEQGARLSGMVTTRYPPYEPIAGVKVSLPAENRHSFSDDAGKFRIQGITPGIHEVLYESDTHVTRQDSIEFEAGGDLDILIRLNGEPRVDSVSIRTRHVDHWPPQEPEFALDLRCWVNDPDGVLDVDSVIFGIPAWGLDTSLSRVNGNGEYSRLLFGETFLPWAFPEIQGVELQLRCRDQAGDWGAWNIRQVSRLILTTPQTYSPAALTTTTPIPIFRWLSFDAGFQVGYEINVYRLLDAAAPQLVQTSPILPDSLLEWEPGAALDPGNYYWTLSVQDVFGNRSSSREATFIVESP